MGRYLKNTVIESGSYAARFPTGRYDLGPNFPVNGQVRFNSNNDTVEIFVSNAWRSLALAGRSTIHKELYYGDGVTDDWVMANQYNPGEEAQLLVFVGGVFQNPSVAYTVNGYHITFTSPPNNLLPIVILQNFDSTIVQ